MPPVGFEPTVPADVRPRTHALDRAASGIVRFRYDAAFVCRERNIIFMCVIPVV